MDDVKLNLVLEAKDRTAYDRLLIQLHPELVAEDALKSGNRWLCRRAVGRSTYKSTGQRKSREGCGWSYTERRIIQWAFFRENSERREMPLEERVRAIAFFLQRDVNEICNHLNNRHGIQGFQL